MSLFIDTASSRLIVSLINDNQLLFYYNELEGKEISGKTMVIIDEAFKKVGIKPNDIDDIYIVTGPGSFTGIRVGLTVAKVMGYSLNKRVIPISELELMASGVDSDSIVPIIDARRGYIFGAVYDRNLNSIIEDEYISYEEFSKTIPSNGKMVSYDFGYDMPQIDLIKIINKHKFDETVNIHNLNPRYLKLTEAEENKL